QHHLFSLDLAIRNQIIGRFAFLDSDEAVHGKIQKFLREATWPAHLNGVDLRPPLQAEMQPRVILRKIAAAPALFVNLYEVSRDDFDPSAVSATVALAANQLKREKVVPIAAVVAENRRRAVEVIDDYVHVAIVVEIAERRATTDGRLIHCRADFRSDRGERSVTVVAVKQLALRVRDLQLRSRQLRIDVAVDHHQIQPAVVVIIEKSAAPTDIGQARAPGLSSV